MKDKIENVTIGADIEVFLINEDKKYISSVGLIGGSKDDPRYLSERGHAAQEDNVTAEFNIPPVRTADEFAKEINFSLSEMKKILPSSLSYCLTPSAMFDKDQLNTEAACQFGCEPDYNAYTLEKNAKPNITINPQLRSIGGHLHIGYENPDMEINTELLKLMDLTLGVPSVLIDKDKQRRILYGKAGAFRPKPYGVEYRTLSSFWIKDDETMKWVFDSVMLAIDLFNKGYRSNPKDYEKVQYCINTGNEGMAKSIIKATTELWSKTVNASKLFMH